MNIQRLNTIALIVFFLSVCFKINYAQDHQFANEDFGIIEVPTERNIEWKDESKIYDTLISTWAKRPVVYGKKGGKVNNPRILLARLHRGTNIEETNKIIMGMTPWGVSGSSWILNKRGDYDFTITVLTTILYQFGDNPEFLYEETVNHLLNVLLTEEGNKFRHHTPRTLGLLQETENHLLMTEGSRYLKNRWLAIHGNNDPKYDNISNGMESKILDLLLEMKINGLYEFNSMPYIGYTITALLNLEAYASENIRNEARAVLDYMNFCYALGSYNYKYFPPMRRRYERANWLELTTGYHSTFMKTWMSFLPNSKIKTKIKSGQAHAIMGACMPYRPADRVTELISKKENGYYVKIGHGNKASPEIYSAGKNFLLSAGGVNRGRKSQIVSRPITLLIEDKAENLSETFHLAGPGTKFMKWNNTGVYKNFACAAGPVSVPKNHKPAFQSKSWSVYKGGEDLYIAVFSSENLGIIAVFDDQNPEIIAQNLEKENPDLEKLKTHFQFPEGPLIQYNVCARKSKWVITQIDNNPVERKYDSWPLISGEFGK